MPAWDQLLGEIKSQSSPQDTVRRKYLEKLSEYTGRNTIVYYSAWMQKPGLLRDPNIDISISDEDKNGFMSTIHQLDRSIGLDLFLHTPGGDMAATESIVRYLRSMFGNNIRAIIPQQAMSGGTIMALSCNSIVLGKGSSIGPIDPQMNGMALNGILEEFNEIKDEITRNPASALVWQHVLQKITPGFITECQNVIDWSTEMATEFLSTNMFVDAKPSEVDQVVKQLTEKSITKTHGRQISLEEAKQIFGDKIITLEDDQQLQDLVLSVHHATMITLQQTDTCKIIENQNGRAHILMAAQQL